MIVIKYTMTEEYNPNVMDNYNRLKKKYENGFLEKSINFEENLTETNMKETMSNFNYLMKTKIPQYSAKRSLTLLSNFKKILK